MGLVVIFLIVFAIIGLVALLVMQSERNARIKAYALLDDPHPEPEALRAMIKRLSDSAAVTRNPEVTSLIDQLQQRLMDSHAHARQR